MRHVGSWLVVCLTLMSACAPPARRDAGDLVLATGNSPTNLDPGVGLDEASQRVQSLIFSSLLKFGDDLRIVPDLATSFETSDFQTYVATLPRGVHFHDGRELTAADVTYTFRRFLDPTFISARKGAYQDLASVDARDRYTVAFVLRRPTASFAANIANVGIVPDGSGATIARAPVGSGPYRLVEFVPDDHVTLAAFTDYYRGTPQNRGVRFKVVPDATMRGLELRKGDVDLVINDLTPDLVEGLQRQPGLKVITAPGTDFAYIGLNVQDPILADRRVRQAIGYAVDREAIVRYLQRGQARQTPGLIPSMSWAYTDDIFTFTRDLARATALLDEAGYPDPDGDGSPRRDPLAELSARERFRARQRRDAGGHPGDHHTPPRRPGAVGPRTARCQRHQCGVGAFRTATGAGHHRHHLRA